MPVGVTTSAPPMSPTTGTGRSAEAGRGCTGNPSHLVQFYEKEEFLYGAVADFLAAGLRVGERAIAIVTERHRAGCSAQLKARGISVDHVVQTGQLTFVDARDMLSRFMQGAMPDERLFEEHVVGSFERIRGGRNAKKVRVYGEMVNVLSREGKYAAALRLEELWNELLDRSGFPLLCAYALENFDSAAQGEGFIEVCRKHGKVVPAEGYTLATDDSARAHEICVLQQRSRALDNEVERRKVLEGALRDALATNWRAEEALIDVQEAADRMKVEFLAVVSHELRTPLNTIMGYQDLLAHGVSGPVTPMQKEHLARIKGGADELLLLVDQMISRSRMEAGQYVLSSEVADLRAIAVEASELAEPSAAESGLKLGFSGPEEPVYAATDAGKVKQILLGLLSNAIKFTERGGVELRLTRENGRLVFAVHDTGIGIQAADVDRIFGPFVQVDASVTRQHGGIGLGLSVGRDLARLLGGDIKVESTPGAGSTFTLSLPAVQPATHSPAKT